MDDFRAALPRLHELQSERASQHAAELADEQAELLASETKNTRRQFALLLRGLLVVSVVLVVVTIVVAAFAAIQVRVRRARLVETYGSSQACLDRGDYQCAVEGFTQVLQIAPDYPGALAGLNQARYGLAAQYAQAGQWRNAVTELDLVLKDDPAHAAALALLKDVYDRWLRDAIGRAQWIEAWQVMLQREARFPDVDH